MRPSDRLCRVGGDERALLYIAGCDHAQALAQDVRRTPKRPLALREQVISIGASIGFTTAPDSASPECACGNVMESEREDDDGQGSSP